MRLSKRTLAALCAASLSAVGLSACGGGGVPGGAVVDVGGTLITKTQFNHWMDIAAISTQSTSATSTKAPHVAVPVPPDYTACVAQKLATAPKPAKGQSPPTASAFKSQCASEYTELSQEVLTYLISAEWVLGEAKAEGMSVTPAAVTKSFNSQKAAQFPTAAAYQEFLVSSGQSAADIVFKVKLNLLSNDIQTKATKAGSKVSQAQVASYYAAHQTEFGTSENRSLRLIRTDTLPQAQKVLALLKSGQPFSNVAKKYSVDASKSRGGAVTGVVAGEEVQPLSTDIFSAKLGSLQGPIKTLYGYYIFKVQKIVPATKQALSKVSTEIKQQLVATNQQTLLNKFIAAYRKRWTAKTTCAKGYVVSICKNYKAPKTKTGATGASGASGAVTAG
ncbi:MAG TPA: peptidyl-prolyl cis-trans isomerase [Solirubrobacteraceae bacterium]|nr:peptidyl-prolyl cis-trans isomerase [Solirubrobacteraceae bacterium]